MTSTSAPGSPPGTASEILPAVAAGACRHLNEHHASEALLIVRALGGAPQARCADAVDMDATGIVFRVEEPSATRNLRVAFATAALDRHELRVRVMELHAAAVTQAASRYG